MGKTVSILKCLYDKKIFCFFNPLCLFLIIYVVKLYNPLSGKKTASYVPTFPHKIPRQGLPLAPDFLTQKTRFNPPRKF